MGDITTLIERASGGDAEAVNSLFERLYPELRRLAHARLGQGSPDRILGTTALVHECFLKLRGAGRLSLNDRAHFMAYAASVMRSVIVDVARARRAERRGGDAVAVTLDSRVADETPAPEDEILDVHEALRALGALDERLVKVVEMRYFAGLEEAEIGAALGVTERTVRRDWRKARLLLAAALRP